MPIGVWGARPDHNLLPDEGAPLIAGATDDGWGVVEGLGALRITDDWERLQLGAVDRATLSMVLGWLRKAGEDLVLELPRGLTEFSTLIGVAAQLDRLGSERAGKLEPFTGPVIVIGRDTQVAERLSRIRINGIALDHALHAFRLRHDGRLATLAGVVEHRRARWDRAFVYLNTRIGWPVLPNSVRPGLVVIDKSSMSDPELFERALAWTFNANAPRLVVLTALGDASATTSLSIRNRSVLTWPWYDGLLNQVTSGGPAVRSHLIAANVTRSPMPTNGVVEVQAPAIDALFRGIWTKLGEAPRTDDLAPRGFVAARRLVGALTESASSLVRYNGLAAMDARVASLATLRNELDRIDLGGGHAWAMFAESQWPVLRHLAAQLYDLLADDNPKLFALAATIDRLRAERNNRSIIVRVPNLIAGYAVEEDLRDLLGSTAIDGVQFVTWSRLLEWSTDPTVELHAAGPAPWRMPSLFSREANERILLCYEHEIERGARLLDSERRRQVVLASTFASRLPIDVELVPTVSTPLRVDAVVRMDRRPAPQHPPPRLGVDTDLLFGPVTDAPLPIDELGTTSPTGDRWLESSVTAIAISLEPDGARYWTRPDAQIEALVATRVVYIRVEDLNPGATVIVPRGGGREELFARLVVAAEGRADVASLQVLLARWRAACWRAYERSGSWPAVERRMRALGASVTAQSHRAWALGTVIAPDDSYDIERMGQVAGDAMVEREFRRIAAIAQEVRRLHGRLGRVLSGALREAVAGIEAGPNVRALAGLLGGINVAELLEEFDLRQVRAVDKPALIAAARMWTVEVSR